MPFARTLDPQTSHDAAASVTGIQTTQFYVWLHLEKPMTDVELVDAYMADPHAPQASPSGIRSRRAELVEQGMVEATGDKVKLPSGRYANVWARTAEVAGC